MSELTFSSAGVGTLEIDLSQPSKLGPQGTPACVIGTSLRGPAFVPVTVGDFKSFVENFGESDGEKFAPLAVNEWLKNAQSLTFVRTLGVGDGESLPSNAGFKVGAALPQDGAVLAAAAKNSYSTGITEGSTYIIGAYMSGSAGSEVFSSAGITETSYTTVSTVFSVSTSAGLTLTLPVVGDTITWTTLLGVLETSTYDGAAWSNPTGYTVSVTDDGANITDIIITDTAVITEDLTGVIPTHTDGGGAGTATALTAFSGGSDATTSSAAAITRGLLMLPFGVTATLDTYDSTTKTSTLTLVDTTDVDVTSYKVSVDPTSQYYLSKVLNTNPLLIEEMGHLLYSHYEIDEVQAAIITPGVSTPYDEPMFLEDAGAVEDSYKEFEQRFDHAKTPWVKSQSFGTDKFDLFRLHALSDGEFENTNIKISIINISYDRNDSWGTFDIAVRSFDDTDGSQRQLERFAGLTLDPTSSNYIAKKIGDKRTWFNLDKSTQQLQTSGTYENLSKYIRVEVSDDVSQSQIPVNSVPMGHEAYNTLDLSSMSDTENNLPIPYRQNVAVGVGLSKKSYPKLHWGIQFSKIQDLDEPNESFVQSSLIKNLCKFLPDSTTGTIVARQGHEFSLENIEVNVKDDPSDSERAIDWTESEYRFDSTLDDVTTVTRFLKPSDLVGSTNRAYGKFTMIMQGGFDGTNIFREEKSKMLNAACVWEIDDAGNQGGTSGPTVASYRKALDVITSKSDVEIQLLAVPGIRNTSVTQYALDAVESRFDALFISDIQEFDSDDTAIVSEDQVVDVTSTIAQFLGEGFDSSFGAAYFPDVIMTDPITRTQMQVPPSVAVLGALSLNDALAHPWYAPAGFTRGSLSSVEDTTVSFSRANLDSLYEAKINPLTSFPGTEVVIWGQKTMLQAASSLDRVNVRRLLIEIRRSVKNIALGFLFEPNRSETLAAFESKVNPLLQSIQEKSGLDRYKVKIDTETTTQIDVENNTIRGKIYIQPTKTAEFISLDFVVSNTL